MDNNEENMVDSANFVQVWFPGEVKERKLKALKEYIGQLETRLKVTDPALYPRYRARLQNELDLAIEEFKSVTES